MRSPVARHGRPPKGMVTMLLVFFLLALVPLFLVFSKWMLVHRRGMAQSRAQSKEFFAAEGTAHFAQYAIHNGLTGWTTWDLANPANSYSIHMDSATVVAVTITNVGTP